MDDNRSSEYIDVPINIITINKVIHGKNPLNALCVQVAIQPFSSNFCDFLKSVHCSKQNKIIISFAKNETNLWKSSMIKSSKYSQIVAFQTPKNTNVKISKFYVKPHFVWRLLLEILELFSIKKHVKINWKSLFKLLIHSFSIIAVFKYKVFLRSAFMIIILAYLNLYLGNTAILFQILIVLFNLIIFIVSLRESNNDLKNSHNNLDSITDIPS